MPNADMNRLMDHARIRLPGALDAAIQMELFAALNEFFQKSNIWYEDIAFAVQPTADTYLENPEAFTYDVIPTLGTITRLIGVVDTKEMPVRAAMPTLGQVILAYSPNEADTYTARVALTVVDPVTRDGYPEFPDWIMTKYGSGILEGVLGRMMSQIAKPYTSAAGAQFHLKNFKQIVSQAKVEAARQNVYRGQSWRFPQTFASRRYYKT
jgi:hypothetical protein